MYFFELFSMFVFFVVFCALFSPFIGGCLGIAIIFTVLASVFIFFSLNFVWILAIIGVIYLYGLVNKYLKWQKLPEINEYLEDHPQAKRDVGIACYNCGSDKTINHGLLHSSSRLRYYTCSQCGTTLFRFKVL